MTLDEQISGLEHLLNRHIMNHIFLTDFEANCLIAQIKLLKSEKQRLENYELIKNEIVSGH
jgi:hypothetical protein